MEELWEYKYFMKVVISAGGFGTRLIEKTETMPNPNIEIGVKWFFGVLGKYTKSMAISNLFYAWGIKPNS